MTSKKLSHIATISSGQGAPQGKESYSKTGRPFIKAGNLEELLITGNEYESCQLVSQETAAELRLKIFPKGTIVFPKSGMSAKIGRVYQLQSDSYVVNHLATIIANEDLVNSRYIKYFFTQNSPSTLIKDSAYPSIRLEDISNIAFPLPSLDEQREVVKLFDLASSLRQKRKQALGLLDEYLKSTFYDMFGDNSPELSTWPVVKLESLTKAVKNSMRTGPFGSDLKHSEFVDSGIAVIGIDNAVHNKFTWDKRRYITAEKYQKLKRYTLYPRDVIITIMATTGRSAVIPNDIPLSINTKHLAALSLDPKKANPYFISYSIHSDQRIMRQISAKSRGAIMPGLNLGIIKNLEFNLPPVELQNKFEELLHKIEDLKQIMLAQTEELDNQFHSLMQKYFSTNR